MKCNLWAARWTIAPAWLIVALPAWGQSPSHEYDPNETPPKDIAKLLEMRRPDPLAGIDKGALNSLVEQFRRHPELLNNLNVKDLQELQKKFPDLNDPRKLEQLREFAKQQMRQAPPKFDDPPFDWQKFQEALKKIESVQNKQNDENDAKMGAKLRSALNPKKDTVDQPQSQQPKKSKKEEDLTKWISKNLGDSKVLKDMTKDLSKMLGKKGTDNHMFSDLEKEWKSLFGERKEDLNKKEASTLDNLASDLKLPDLKSTGGSSSFGGSSSSSKPEGIGSLSSGSGLGNLGGGSWSTVVLLGLLIGAAFVFWALYIRPRQKQAVADEGGKRRWPVPPAEVETREDVVKAFEYLSVSKCGERAINWHHIQIAKEISGVERHRREAAARLAYLYEKARYAPKNEVFTDTEIAEARARLQQLSGVPAE